MATLTEHDTDISLLKGKRIAILGYGSQGHAHALNLRDDARAEICVALRPGSKRAELAARENLRILTPQAAATWADILMMTVPDEHQGAIYHEYLDANLRPGALVLFAHGFSIRFGLIVPRRDLDIAMVAPMGPGATLRAQIVRGLSMPCMYALHQNATGSARKIALAYAAGIGCARAGIIETTFAEETETDLFCEQTVLCGGLTALITAAYETLVAAGYSREIAYISCSHEVKQIADLVHTRGIAGMHEAISNTAEYGEYKVGPRIIGASARAEMKQVLAEIISGAFAREWVAENAAGLPELKRLRANAASHDIEEIGARMRNLMPWLKG
jgi:ketol-acid reductoisomerase